MKITISEDRNRVSIRIRVASWHDAARGIAATVESKAFEEIGFKPDKASVEKHHRGRRCNLGVTWRRGLGAPELDDVSLERASNGWLAALELHGIDRVG